MNSSADSATDEAGLIPLYRFWQPRYWGLWVALLILRIVTLLPIRRQLGVGKAIGRVGMRFVPKRRRIARVNLRLCFPELDDAAIELLVREHFESMGMSMVEMVLSWWVSKRRVQRLVDISGSEYVNDAADDGKPIILVCGHLAGLEMAGIALRDVLPPLAAMYRPVNNPLADQIVRRARQRSVPSLVPKDSMRGMLRLVRKGIPFWYASDQAYDRKGSALVPFFGEPAMTNCALTQIAQMSKAVVIPFLVRRKPDLRGYDACFLPPLDDFPTEDAVADALRIHGILEDWIRETPAQYYWVHRRFKNRPPPYPDPYAGKRADQPAA